MLGPLIAADAEAAEPRYLLAYALLREDKPADSLKEYTEPPRCARRQRRSCGTSRWIMCC